MNVKIKRIDETLPMPKHHSKGAVAFDLIAREKISIEPKTIAHVPCNLIVLVPEGYMLMLAARSSLPLKKNLMLPNSIGIIDQDYCGPEDELKLQLWNFGEKTATIDKGERIGQAVLVKIEKAEFEELKKIKGPSRGGFGSTGGYYS